VQRVGIVHQVVPVGGEAGGEGLDEHDHQRDHDQEHHDGDGRADEQPAHHGRIFVRAKIGAGGDGVFSHGGASSIVR
jgi:hypothetical protein